MKASMLLKRKRLYPGAMVSFSEKGKLPEATPSLSLRLPTALGSRLLLTHNLWGLSFVEIVKRGVCHLCCYQSSSLTSSLPSESRRIRKLGFLYLTTNR